jgi:hypothetical protein
MMTVFMFPKNEKNNDELLNDFGNFYPSPFIYYTVETNSESFVNFSSRVYPIMLQ